MGNIIQPIWHECPAATRLLLVSYPILSVISLSPFVHELLFQCCWQRVFGQLRLWSLIFATFARPVGAGFAFLFILFEMYTAAQHLPWRERETGSSQFLVWLVMVAAVINTSTMLFVYLLGLVAPGILAAFLGLGPNPFGWDNDSLPCVGNEGMWPVLIMLVTTRAMGDPDGTTSMYGLCAIPNKYYPLALTALFFFLSRQFGIIFGMLIGYAYPHLRLERLLLIRRSRIAACERRCCRERRSCLGTSWILACDTPGFEVETGLRPYATISDFGRLGGVSNQGREMQSTGNSGGGGGSGGGSTGRFECFAGAGNRLGDGTGEAPLGEEQAIVEAQELQAPPEPSAPPREEETRNHAGTEGKDSEERPDEDPEGL